ncbi:MAG: DUF2169 domain-containing protein, partial [Myxococcota bacterium]
MKVVKPHRLGFLSRVMTVDGRRYQLAITGMTYVPLSAPRALGMEIALWKDVAEHIPGGMLDEGNAKPRGEVLVCGSAFAPDGRSVPVVMTRLSVQRGDEVLVDKRVAVQGDRIWRHGGASEPEPFSEMPIDWHRAFGGDGFERNPKGKGAVELEDGTERVRPLPNVEDPDRLVTSPQDRPEPAGYGPLDLTWPQRFRFAGTVYDDAWRRERFPGPALDFDPQLFQAALPDQQIDGWFRGDETIRVEGMHPGGTVEGTLEPLVVKALVTQASPEQPEPAALSHEVVLHLETVVVLPTVERAILLYRGLLPVASDDADDVVHLMLAAEDPAHPKSKQHYQQVLERRLDKERGALFSMRDEDLMPPGEQGWTAKPDYGDMVEKTKLDHRALKKAERGRKAKLAEAKRELLEAGFEVPDDFEGPDTPAIVDPYDVDAVLKVVEEMEAKSQALEAEAKENESRMKEEARAAFAEAGMDWDAEEEKALAQAGGPPDFRADEQLVMLHDMARIAAEGGMAMEDLERDLLDPQYETMLRDLEERVTRAYVEFAHVMPPAPPRSEAEAQRLRVILTASLDADEPVAGRNLSRADLAGMDLRGADLSGAFLEGARLGEANLSGANLRGAVLARADLTDTDLSGANLTDCNLGATRLVRTDLSGANLTRTVLMKCELEGALLHGARFDGVDFLEVVFSHADFSQCEAKQALFLQTDLRGVNFVGAHLVEARFLQVDLRGVDFTGATLTRAQFIQCAGDESVFDGASLEGAQFVHESSFVQSSFGGANL